MDKTLTEHEDDPMIVWMALITERDRLTRLIATRENDGKPLSDKDVEDVKATRTRVEQLAVLVLRTDRVPLVRAAFADPPTRDHDIQIGSPSETLRIVNIWDRLKPQASETLKQ